jgi:hypothetical protein
LTACVIGRLTVTRWADGRASGEIQIFSKPRRSRS